MGYYTTYQISSKGKPFTEDETKAIEELEKQAESLTSELKDIALKGITEKKNRKPKNTRELVTKELGFDPFSDDCKWYDHDKDMREISKKYPETIFILEGEGEESGDIWKKYYLNGKCQVAKAEVIIPEFDETKLV
jgi:hypothetical protein